ncbi:MULTISPECIES: ATP-binding protein [unclassified Lentimonas]|uniref:ATP-binding protein n=1 Tax=unclassified Lentimonas TaxID=2630993 RepID=UPI0013297749|nr:MULTISPECIES: SbcC/MukB-like Walker B domain-containing protein [unclassified Lentimonas]CAA6677380.1 FIG007317: Chromosome segregation protein SMC-like [Lentimonas sp. CC4]CAA6686925.1 FIG007317: Chromosome segregation protein SMC-like [Lentimonas sp. CC6]CAA6690108.1 FIG007317: Chromosome segregation protein SMC-like [Lentimonas sp. CC19]CAA6690930.1 FIG007317: Chromosome segregation protein SMC-like [Lentimonas sp. CC10]CAA7070718.1 FIG007317: Chromosome segregation protein SMC-like [Len
MNAQTQATLEYAPDRSTAGFRLHQFSVLNWGTFHGRVHSFSPDGRTSLLSGGNGAGKSTLADAVLTLLIESRKRNYNQASAGGGERKQRKERSEKDYVLGTYSEEHDQNLGYGRAKQLRKAGKSVTVLLGTFYNETYNQHVTLAQVIWLTPAKKMDRAFIVVRKRLSIEGDFNDLGEPSEVRKRLKARGLEPLDTFSAYSQRFHEALSLSPDKNPMDIFNQAICIKDISNLTNFIREYMLDDGGAPQQLEGLRASFEDLRRTYERIEREKRRLDQLNAIHSLHNTVLVQEDQIDHWQGCIDAAPLFFAESELVLRQAEAEVIDLEVTKAKAEEVSEIQKADKEEERIQDLKSSIESSSAGRRLQEIEKDLVRLKSDVESKKPRQERFIKKVEAWQAGLVCQSEDNFLQVMADAQKDKERLKVESKQLEVTLKKKDTEYEQLSEQQALINTEVRSLQEREGNIGDKLIRIRGRIADALGVSPKELPFVGELVQVKDDETRWTGPIEHLVHSFALCMLVPGRLRKQVDKYAHRTNLKGLLVYHVVESGARSRNPQLDSSAVAAKLELHESIGEFESWLSAELSYRFDHQCCEAPDDVFNQAKAAITIGGLIKQRGSERRKDDRRDINDRSNDVLGWDNSRKINTLQKQHDTLETKRDELLSSIRQQTNGKKEIDTAINAIGALPQIAETWEEIDYFTPTLAQETLRLEQKELEAGSDELSRLQKQLKAAKGAKRDATEKSGNARERFGEWNGNKKLNDTGIKDCKHLIDFVSQDPAGLQKFNDRRPSIQELIDAPATSVAGLATVNQKVTAELEDKRRNARRDRDDAGNKAKFKMQKFLDGIKNEDSKLHDDLYAEGIQLKGYNSALFEPFDSLRLQIKEADLPRNQKRFKNLLQTNLIEDVSSFDGILQEHAETIKRRIEDLNLHLKEVDFDRNKHSYIQLVPVRTDDEHQQWFRGIRQYALENIAHVEDSDEARNERFNRVRNLLDELASDEKRTQRVIDVRNWFEFRADEFYRDNDESFQCYSGASGKSGGEKNRLASTILATAIAYQYGISLNNENQTETFRLVIVDEMFSKTDDEFSTYLLELFKQFSLQLIIVQPLDSKVHLVQKYVERYHIVTRPSVHSEIHNLNVHEYEKLMGEVAER